MRDRLSIWDHHQRKYRVCCPRGTAVPLMSWNHLGCISSWVETQPRIITAKALTHDCAFWNNNWHFRFWVCFLVEPLPNTGQLQIAAQTSLHQQRPYRHNFACLKASASQNLAVRRSPLQDQPILQGGSRVLHWHEIIEFPTSAG